MHIVVNLDEKYCWMIGGLRWNINIQGMKTM